jgi:diguanylate cyclase (GGDEF)-like protein/PAS domain S-box-containing protein
VEWSARSRSPVEGRRVATGLELLSAIVASCDDAIVGISLDGKILSWNRGAEALYGFTADEVVGTNIACVIPVDRAHELAVILTRVATGKPVDHYETNHCHSDGSVIDVSVATSPVLDARRETVAASMIVRDIGRQTQARLRLAHQALHDALTGLPNRALLRDRIESALARAERSGTSVAVLFLDLDGFKPLNDRLGHAGGDQILRIVAERLQRAVRPDDTVARFGGDEFVIVCHDIVVEEQARTIAERVAAAVAKPLLLDDERVVIRASIGVVLGRPGANPDALVNDADAAMYQVKRRTLRKYR